MIPTDSNKAHVAERLAERASDRWPQIARLEIRQRREFYYVDAYLHGETTALRLCRLRFDGDRFCWQLAMCEKGRSGYQEFSPPKRKLIATPEEAFDRACHMHFGSRSPGWPLPTAIVLTAASMGAFAVYIARSSLVKAVEVATIVGTFAGIAVLLTSLIALQVSLGAQSPRWWPERSSLKNAGRGKARQSRLKFLDLPGAATALLVVPLAVFSSDSLQRYSQAWPWWTAVAATATGLCLTLLSARRNLWLSAVLSFNLLWLLSYSILILRIRGSAPTPTHLAQLAALSLVSAVCDLLLALILAVSFLRGIRGASSWLAMLFLGLLAVGSGITGFALRGETNTPWNVAGIVFAAALFIDLVLVAAGPVSVARTSPTTVSGATD